MAKLKRLTILNSGEHKEQVEFSHLVSGSVKMIQLLWKNVWQILIKLNIHPIVCLNICLREMKTDAYRDSYKNVHRCFIYSSPNWNKAKWL